MDVVQAEATLEAVITGKAIPEVVAAVVEAEVEVPTEEEVPTVVVEEATVAVDMVVGTAAVEETLEIQLGNSVRVRGKQLVISSV